MFRVKRLLKNKKLLVLLGLIIIVALAVVIFILCSKNAKEVNKVNNTDVTILTDSAIDDSDGKNKKASSQAINPWDPETQKKYAGTDVHSR
ncbi:MAG: hypothetical protein LBD41_03635 [Clostridiales Family XIII bacterium]|jgi:hypothetical protein|nr:hypothetical protein [Clostridiales Family XIII bacterium]